MKNTSHVLQGSYLRNSNRIPGEVDPLLLMVSDNAINRGRFGNNEPKYFADQAYTVWVYDLQLDAETELPVKLPKVSAAMLYNLQGETILNNYRFPQLQLLEKSYSPLSLQPGQHTLEMKPGYSKILFLLFHPPYVTLESGPGANSEPCELQPKEKAILIDNTCQQLIEEMQSKEYHGELWRLKRQVLILDLFFKSLDQIGVPLHREQPFEQHPDYEKMVNMQVYIKDNIDRKLSTMQLAQKFDMSPPQLRRTYYQVFQHHMWEFVRAERLHRAKVLLIETKMAVHEIAWEVGYESAAGFTRVFSFTFSQSPTDYRKTSRKMIG